jgi:hypothetical protein
LNFGQIDKYDAGGLAAFTDTRCGGGSFLENSQTTNRTNTLDAEREERQARRSGWFGDEGGDGGVVELVAKDEDASSGPGCFLFSEGASEPLNRLPPVWADSAR